MALTDPSNLLLLAASLLLLVLSVVALVDCLRRPAAAFPAAGKLTKPIWTGILLACVAFSLLGYGILSIFGAVVAVAATVYLVDVKPAVAQMRPGGPWA